MGNVIPEKDKLTAAKPEPIVKASLKLLLIDTKNKANDCVAIINNNNPVIIANLLPFKGKSCHTNILYNMIKPTRKNQMVTGKTLPIIKGDN